MAPERPPSPPCLSLTSTGASTLSMTSVSISEQVSPGSSAAVSPASSGISSKGSTRSNSNGGVPDDELTSLSWLQDKNLLRGINLCNKTQMATEIEIPSNHIAHDHHHIQSVEQRPSPTSDYLEDSCISEDNNTQNSSSDQSMTYTISESVNNNSISKNQNILDEYKYECKYKNDYHRPKTEYYTPIKSAKQVTPVKHKHPSNVPYDPLIHTSNKPPYSFSCLIFMAIEDCSAKALPVKEIYAWIVAHFPYFKNAPTGWKNSVRHNLSLNKCFQKVEKAPNLGKGSLWMVDEKYRPNLLQALTRSPFHPCSTLDPNSFRSPSKVVPAKESTPQILKTGGGRLPNPELFPFLSRRLAASEMNDTESTPVRLNWSASGWTADRNTDSADSVTQAWTTEALESVNAATAMLALKHGPKMFSEGFKQANGVPVITSSPSEDHTYSAGGPRSGSSGGSGSPDAAYESDDSQNMHLSMAEIEEQRRLAEGADALLNLAGMCRTQSYSPVNNTNGSNSWHEEQHDEEEIQNSERIKFKPRLLRKPKRKYSSHEAEDQVRLKHNYINNNNSNQNKNSIHMTSAKKRIKFEWSHNE